MIVKQHTLTSIHSEKVGIKNSPDAVIPRSLSNYLFAKIAINMRVIEASHNSAMQHHLISQ